MGGNIVADPLSIRAALLLDMFSALEDALRLDLEILQDSGNHILVANLTVRGLVFCICVYGLGRIC